MTGLSNAKEVGKKIISSKIFWYVIAGFVVFAIVKKPILAILEFLGVKTQKQSDEEKELANQKVYIVSETSILVKWWTDTGENLLFQLKEALQNEYWLNTQRNAIFEKMLVLSDIQLKFMSNRWISKRYAAEFGNKSMFRALEDENSLFSQGYYVFGDTPLKRLLSKLKSLKIS